MPPLTLERGGIRLESSKVWALLGLELEDKVDRVAGMHLHGNVRQRPDVDVGRRCAAGTSRPRAERRREVNATRAWTSRLPKLTTNISWPSRARQRATATPSTRYVAVSRVSLRRLANQPAFPLDHSLLSSSQLACPAQTSPRHLVLQRPSPCNSRVYVISILGSVKPRVLSGPCDITLESCRHHFVAERSSTTCLRLQQKKTRTVRRS